MLLKPSPHTALGNYIQHEDGRQAAGRKTGALPRVPLEVDDCSVRSISDGTVSPSLSSSSLSSPSISLSDGAEIDDDFDFDFDLMDDFVDVFST